MSCVFKLKKANITAAEENFDTKPSWEALTSRIYAKFGIFSKDVVVAFVEDGKAITLRDNIELQSFYSTHHSSEVTFVIQDLKTPDNGDFSVFFFVDHLDNLCRAFFQSQSLRHGLRSQTFLMCPGAVSNAVVIP